MNLRFWSFVVVSAGVHALLLWAIAAPVRPPVLLLPYGQISVEVSVGSGSVPGLPGAAAPYSPDNSPRVTPAVAAPVPKPPVRPPAPTPPAAEPLPLPKPEPLPAPRAFEEQTPSLQPAKPLPATRAAGMPVQPEAGGERPKPATPAPPGPASGSPTPAKSSGPSAGSGRASGSPDSSGSGGRMSGVKHGARLIENRMPPYPREAQRLGLEGRVVVRLRISVEGRVLESALHQSSGHEILDDATVRWAETLRFLPARAGKKAVETEALLPVRYRLVDSY